MFQITNNMKKIRVHSFDVVAPSQSAP